MLPRNYPSKTDANGDNKVIVFELSSTTGLKAWVDYIPSAVQATPLAPNRYRTDDKGYHGYHLLVSVTGLKAWVDYIPIDTITFVQAKAWRSDDAGFIPYVDET